MFVTSFFSVAADLAPSHGSDSERSGRKMNKKYENTLFGSPFCAPAFSYVVRTKKGPLLCHTCTWFVTRKAPCYLAVTWERRRTKILKGLCGVIGWFQVAADIGLPLK